MHHAHLLRPLLLASALTAAAVQAAPTTDITAAPEAQPGLVKPSTGPLGVRSNDTHRDARTIDLLVEMQQPTAGIQFNERSARRSNEEGLARPAATAPARPAVPAAIEAPPTPPSGLFGSGATPAVQARSVAVDAHSRSAEMPGRPSPKPGSEAPPELKRWLAWPRQVIEYIRENRTWVAGTTATLLLLGWTASVMFNRRRG
jgi:hypothetical protein